MTSQTQERLGDVEAACRNARLMLLSDTSSAEHNTRRRLLTPSNPESAAEYEYLTMDRIFPPQSHIPVLERRTIH